MYFILLYAVTGRLADSAALRSARAHTERIPSDWASLVETKTPEYRLQLAVLPSNVWPNL